MPAIGRDEVLVRVKAAAVDPHEFSIENADEALKLVSNGRINGKVLIRM